MGSHRYPRSWLDNRFGWLDVNGKPIEPDWRRTLKDTKTLATGDPAIVTETVMKCLSKDQYTWDEDRFTQYHIVTMCGVEIEVPVLDLEFDEMVAMPEELAEL